MQTKMCKLIVTDSNMMAIKIAMSISQEKKLTATCWEVGISHLTHNKSWSIHGIIMELN